MLEQMKTFREAVKFGSFSGAARELHLTQSAVTHQVKRLQERLGVRLYERLRRGIRPTVHGEKLVEFADEFTTRIEDMETYFKTATMESEKQISIASHRGILRYKLPPVIAEFKETYPWIGMSLFNKSRDEDILRMVRSGEVDFGIITSWNVVDELVFHQFLTYDMYLCVRDDHPLAGIDSDAITMEQISAERLLLYEAETSIRRTIDSVFRSRKLEMHVAVEIGGAGMLIDYAQLGLGAAITSGLPFDDDKERDIWKISVSRFFGKLGYGFVFRKNKFLSPALMDLMTLLDGGFTYGGEIGI